MSELGLLTVTPFGKRVRVSTGRTTDDLEPAEAIEMGRTLIQAGDTLVMHPGGKALVSFSNWKTELPVDDVLKLGRTLVEIGEALS